MNLRSLQSEVSLHLVDRDRRFPPSIQVIQSILGDHTPALWSRSLDRGTIYVMVKTTMYLPDELTSRLEAEAMASGCSKAELIRRAIGMLLNASSQPTQAGALPVFDSGNPMSADEMDEAIHDRVKQQAERR